MRKVYLYDVSGYFLRVEWFPEGISVNNATETSIPSGDVLEEGNVWRFNNTEWVQVLKPSLPAQSPPEEVVTGFGRIITELAYRKRFTQAEKVAIQIASYGSNPINATLAVNLADLAAARYVHLDRQDSHDSTHALELAGLIGVGRADVILSDPVYSNELLTETRLHYGLSPIPSETEMLVNGGRGYASLNDYLANETL